MYVVANISTLYRMEHLGMVSRGLESLKKHTKQYICEPKSEIEDLIYSTCDVTKNVIFGRSSEASSSEAFGCSEMSPKQSSR